MWPFFWDFILAPTPWKNEMSLRYWNVLLAQVWMSGFSPPWEEKNDGQDLVVWYSGREGRTAWWEPLLRRIPPRICWITASRHTNSLTRLVVNLNDRAEWALSDQVSLRTNNPKKISRYLWSGLECFWRLENEFCFWKSLSFKILSQLMIIFGAIWVITVPWKAALWMADNTKTRDIYYFDLNIT